MTASAALALLDRPGTGLLTFATLFVVIGWGWTLWSWWSTQPPAVEPGTADRPSVDESGTLEPPAVVGLLTNGFQTPPSAVTATVLDLAARGWLRLTSTDGELVVVSSTTPADGDALAGFEQQVYNHIASRAFNDYTSAGTIAVAQGEIGARWFGRFNQSVVRAAARRGLCTERYPIAQTAAVAAAGVVAAMLLVLAVFNGDEIAVAESLWSRGIWFVVLFGAVTLVAAMAYRYLNAAQRPTEHGIQRATDWLGYRQRLASRIPANASVLGSQKQQRALSNAVVMGVVDHVFRQVPIVRPGPFRAWSEAGGVPHVVSVRYPIRPGFGYHPVRVALVGIVGIIIVNWLRGFLGGVADGTQLRSQLDGLPTGSSAIETLAEVLSIVLVAPLVVLWWCALAGLVDTVLSRERLGMVVRARPPEEVLPRWLTRVVKPFGGRSGYLVYVGLDDGRLPWVTAALATDRTAVPQGAQARLTTTPLLGYVHEAEPIGTAGAEFEPAADVSRD